jgi:DNA helicase-2/ATP-dependent DNA helicase PcrA
VAALRPFFKRRIPLWEGHTRKGLEALVDLLATPQTPEALAKGILKFMGKVGTGFSASAFGNALQKEAREGCTSTRRGKPAKIQSLAQLLVDQPDFRGVAKVLARIAALRESDNDFHDVQIDHWKEFWEAISLGEYATVEEGLSHVAHKRTYSRPSPPAKSLSTVHRAKGLECDDVLLVACDADQFPDTPAGRYLLYVALSRAKKRLMIVIPRSNPTPLFNV